MATPIRSKLGAFVRSPLGVRETEQVVPGAYALCGFQIPWVGLWGADGTEVFREYGPSPPDRNQRMRLYEVAGELQRIYVVRAQQVQEAELKNAGINPQDLQPPLQ